MDLKPDGPETRRTWKRGGVDVVTGFGPARLTWHGGLPGEAAALLLLGHGAGGGIAAPDLTLVAALARDREIAVGLVEQPYRVAGRRAPAPARQLDAAFAEVALAARGAITAGGESVPLIVGGRSSGARVACRTARSLGACGVIALAFPLQPPRPPERPAPSRLPELLGAGVPVLVVQGERDAFGTAQQLGAALGSPEASSGAATDIVVSAAAGADHALRKGVDTAALAAWLARFLR
jgi:predicted alpha/beta-hydrolase family hydrolase